MLLIRGRSEIVRHAMHCLLDPFCERVCTINTDVLMILMWYVAESDNITTCSTTSDSLLVSLVLKSVELFYSSTLSPDVRWCRVSLIRVRVTKAWDMWLNSINTQLYTDLFAKLSDEPATITERDFDILEMFEIELYAPSARRIASQFVWIDLILNT